MSHLQTGRLFAVNAHLEPGQLLRTGDGKLYTLVTRDHTRDQTRVVQHQLPVKTHVVTQSPLQSRDPPSVKHTKITSAVHSIPLRIVSPKKTEVVKTVTDTVSGYLAPSQVKVVKEKLGESAHVQSYFSFPSAGINSINYEYNTQ